LKHKVEFDPLDWDDISDEAKELITLMLEKDPSKRISIVDSLSHRWFKNAGSGRSNLDSKII
jgi:serine/threonine protein kinase